MYRTGTSGTAFAAACCSSCSPTLICHAMDRVLYKAACTRTAGPSPAPAWAAVASTAGAARCGAGLRSWHWWLPAVGHGRQKQARGSGHVAVVSGAGAWSDLPISAHGSHPIRAHVCLQLPPSPAELPTALSPTCTSLAPNQLGAATASLYTCSQGAGWHESLASGSHQASRRINASVRKEQYAVRKEVCLCHAASAAVIASALNAHHVQGTSRVRAVVAQQVVAAVHH